VGYWAITGPRKEKHLSAEAYGGKPSVKEARLYKEKDPNEEGVS